MKITHQNVQRSLGAALVGLVLLPCLLAGQAAAESSLRLSRKEVKALLANGNNTTDQERLAAYYRDKARDLKAKAQEFSAQADTLAGQPATIESKQGISCNCASHYRYFSKLYAQQAQESETLAAQHEQMAKEYVARQTTQR